MKQTNNPNLQTRLENMGMNDNLTQYIAGNSGSKTDLLTESNFDSEVS